MKFTWEPAATFIDGELIYRQREYSIDFEVASNDLLAERVGVAGNTSILLTTLQLEVGIERGEILFPWGYFPITRWRTGRLTLPIFQSGRVRVVCEGEKLLLGVSIPFSESLSWPVVWDRNSGWICFGNATPCHDVIAVEYAKNSAIVIVEGKLFSLWLRPNMVN